MKTLTWIAFVTEKERARRLETLADLQTALEQASNGKLTEENFCLDWLGEADLGINLKNIFFEIDGLEVRDWLKRWTDFEGEGDSWTQIKHFRV